MPKRFIDYDALWPSEKLERCPEWARTEYLWAYGLADANGVFEMTNLRALWAKVSPIRPSLTLDVFKEAIGLFERHGLLFTWSQNAKKYGYWTNADKDHRLPPPSERGRYKTCGVKPDRKQIDTYELTTVSGVHREAIEMQSGLGLVVGLGLGVEVVKHSPNGNTSGADAPELVIPRLTPEKKPATPTLETTPFELFWEAYPKKLDKAWARRAWNKLIKPDDHILEILAGVEGWLKSGSWDDHTFIPYPGKFLGHKQWENVPDRRSSGTTKGNAKHAGALHSEPGKQYPKGRSFTI